MTLPKTELYSRPISPDWSMIKSIIDVSLDSILVIDKNLNIALFNQAFQAYYKYFDNQILEVGQAFAKLYPNHHALSHQLVSAFESVFCGKSLTVETEIKEKEQVRSESFRLSPVWDESGKISGGTCSIPHHTLQQNTSVQVQDQTEYNQEIENLNLILSTNLKDSLVALEEAERVLKYSDRRFKSIYEYVPTGIGLFDSSGKIVEANPALQQILGYSMNELARVPLATLIHTNGINNDFSLFDELLSGKMPSYQIEKQFIRSDGKMVWALLNVSLLHDMGEEEIYIIGTIQDITSLKSLEQTLQQKNMELVKANSYLDNFVYAIAHDLRAPIANLKQISQLIIMNCHSKDPLFEKLQFSVEYLDRIASGLIHIIDAQKVEGSQINRISFSDKIAMIREDMSAQIKDLQAMIEQDIEVGEIIYIEPYLDSILRNLIQNSLKYAHRKRKPRIRIHIYQQAEYIVFSIQDNGIGINLKEAGELLFRPFKRFTAVASGHGIGLHLVKNMVEKNDGKIEVTSTPGKGTTFTLFLRPYNLQNAFPQDLYY